MATYRTDGATFNTSSGSKTVVLTPAIGDVVIVFAANTGQTSTPTISDNNSDSSTYTTITTALKNSSADLLCAFVRDKNMINTTSTTWTMAPGTTTGGGLWVVLIRGMTKTSSTAIRSNGAQANQAAATPAPVLNNTPLAQNLCLSAVFNATNPGGLTAGSGFTRRQDVGYSNPVSGLDGETDDNGQTGATLTWGSSSASAFASIGLELDTTNPFALLDWPEPHFVMPPRTPSDDYNSLTIQHSIAPTLRN